MSEFRDQNDFSRKFKNYIKVFYDKLVKINDSPHRIAFGFALGVFLGILPGVGPVASLALAFVFKVNSVAALTGSLLTNTWLSVVTFLASIKIGSAIFGVQWQDIYDQCKTIFSNFNLKNLSNISILGILLPLIVGYAIIALVAGFVAYLILMIILTQKKITKRDNHAK